MSDVIAETPDGFAEGDDGVPVDTGGLVQVSEHELPRDFYYVRIAVALAVVTGCEVAISSLGMPTPIEITLLLVLMAIKFVARRDTGGTFQVGCRRPARVRVTWMRRPAGW